MEEFPEQRLVIEPIVFTVAFFCCLSVLTAGFNHA